MSIFLKVTTNWRAGCKKSACPGQFLELFETPSNSDRIGKISQGAGFLFLYLVLQKLFPVE